MRRFDILRSGLAGIVASAAGPALAAIGGYPAGSGLIVGAVNWLQGTLLGTVATVATVAAVIAVAAVGFMLTGRINWRHGAVVILSQRSIAINRNGRYPDLCP